MYMCSDIENIRIWHKQALKFCINSKISAQIVQKFRRKIICAEFQHIRVYEAPIIAHEFFPSLARAVVLGVKLAFQSKSTKPQN